MLTVILYQSKIPLSSQKKYIKQYNPCPIKKMSIKKTEQFLYFQNKARHYQNIRNVRPCVQDKLQKQYRYTIDHSSNRNIQPYMRMYNIQVGNQSLINRLVNISRSKRVEVSVQGHSRWNSVEREFRKKNPYKDAENQKIYQENQRMVSRLDQTKPIVGSTSEWLNEYQRNLNHRKNLSRYDDSHNSKGSLHISTSRFVPEHYKSYIGNLDGGTELQEGRSTIKVISKEKLTRLPRILNSQRSSSILRSNKSQNDLFEL